MPRNLEKPDLTSFICATRCPLLTICIRTYLFESDCKRCSDENPVAKEGEEGRPAGEHGARHPWPAEHGVSGRLTGTQNTDRVRKFVEGLGNGRERERRAGAEGENE